MTGFVQRSMLIMPLNVPRFVEKAHLRNADAILLDLEDAVPPAEKAQARRAVKQAILSAARGGADVLVRVNNDREMLNDDLDASVFPGLHGIFLPKVEAAEQVTEVEAVITDLEKLRGIDQGTVKLAIHVESPKGILGCEDIAAAGARAESISLGTDDYRLEMGIRPSEDSTDLLHPMSVLAIVAAARGIAALGVMGSVAEFSDLDAFERAAVNSRNLGFVGAYCIHPGQVPILNRVFSPLEESVLEARRVIEAFERALEEGRGSTSLDGRMIDMPVYKQALRTAALADAVAAREAAKAAALALSGEPRA
jgi:citrate lyase subunit beta/citryl-CoA lyase